MGLEPTTHGTTIRYSNQLSYIHRVFASANIQLFFVRISSQIIFFFIFVLLKKIQ